MRFPTTLLSEGVPGRHRVQMPWVAGGRFLTAACAAGPPRASVHAAWSACCGCARIVLRGAPQLAPWNERGRVLVAAAFWRRCARWEAARRAPCRFVQGAHDCAAAAGQQLPGATSRNFRADTWAAGGHFWLGARVGSFGVCLEHCCLEIGARSASSGALVLVSCSGAALLMGLWCQAARRTVNALLKHWLPQSTGACRMQGNKLQTVQKVEVSGQSMPADYLGENIDRSRNPSSSATAMLLTLSGPQGALSAVPIQYSPRASNKSSIMVLEGCVLNSTLFLNTP